MISVKNFRYLIFILILAIAFFNSNASAKIDPKNLAGMWLFEDGGGDKVTDASGKNNHGTVAGPIKWVNGKFGRAIELNGSTTWVEVKSSDSLVLEELTMVAWAKLKPSKGVRWQSIMMKGQNPRNYLLCVDKDTQTLQLSVTKGAPDAWGGPIGGPAVTDGEWHHLAGVIGQKAGYVIYNDGLKVGNQAYAKPSLNANPDVLRIGDGSGGGHQVEGILDEVAIFNIPLEEADIQDIMNNGLEKVTGKSFAINAFGKLAAAWGDIKKSISLIEFD